MILTCCCCGNGAPAKKQWWNRDSGYGLCGECAEYLKQSMDPEEFKSYYGEEGVHWMPIEGASSGQTTSAVENRNNHLD